MRLLEFAAQVAVAVDRFARLRSTRIERFDAWQQGRWIRVYIDNGTRHAYHDFPLEQVASGDVTGIALERAAETLTVRLTKGDPIGSEQRASIPRPTRGLASGSD